MSAAGSAGSPGEGVEPAQFAELIPLVRRVVAARVPDRATVDDLVQETLTRVLAAVGRIGPGMLEPYAIVTAQERRRLAVARPGPGPAQPAPGRGPPPVRGAGRGAPGRRGPNGGRRGAGPPHRPGAGDPAGPRGVRAGHPLARRGARVHRRRGRRPAQPQSRPAPGRVPAGGRARRTPDGPVPAGAAGALGRRPPSPGGGGRGPAPAGVRLLRADQRAADRPGAVAHRRRPRPRAGRPPTSSPPGRRSARWPPGSGSLRPTRRPSPPRSRR
ncbi:sigma-70 family RNA polymerase sigma factor [Blastococcus sp. TML/M2B]|nr:sigma-70 family RNA polymerase sigma factor [Blastococcus sp. TML/M2B]